MSKFPVLNAGNLSSPPTKLRHSVRAALRISQHIRNTLRDENAPKITDSKFLRSYEPSLQTPSVLIPHAPSQSRLPYHTLLHGCIKSGNYWRAYRNLLNPIRPRVHRKTVDSVLASLVRDEKPAQATKLYNAFPPSRERFRFLFDGLIRMKEYLFATELLSISTSLASNEDLEVLSELLIAAYHERQESHVLSQISESLHTLASLLRKRQLPWPELTQPVRAMFTYLKRVDLRLIPGKRQDRVYDYVDKTLVDLICNLPTSPASSTSTPPLSFRTLSNLLSLTRQRWKRKDWEDVVADRIAKQYLGEDKGAEDAYKMLETPQKVSAHRYAQEQKWLNQLANEDLWINSHGQGRMDSYQTSEGSLSEEKEGKEGEDALTKHVSFGRLVQAWHGLSDDAHRRRRQRRRR